MDRFTNKIALVTGAAGKRSFGCSIALGLAQEGANVIVTDRVAVPPTLFKEDEGWGGLNDVVTQIQSFGRMSQSAMVDLRQVDQVNQLVDSIFKYYGRLDILVNCENIVGKRETSVADIAEKDWQYVLDVNLKGTFIVSKIVGKEMVKRGQGGKIVHIASQEGKRGFEGLAPYCASKFAVIGLVQSLALELARYNINVNAVCPGYMITDLRDDWLIEQAQNSGMGINAVRDTYHKTVSSCVPLGRMGTVEDVRNTVLFLASNESDYMTGQSINVTGGCVLN